MDRKSSFVFALVLVVGLGGCKSPSPEVTTSSDGRSGTISNPDGTKTTFFSSSDGSNATINDGKGKSATMSTDKNGTTTIKSEGGTSETGGTITEEDLGIVIYPGATQIPHKGSKIEAGGKKIVMGQFETADAPDKVIDFYASKLKVSGSAIKSEAMNLVTGTLPSGAKITVSAKTEDGKTHINLNASLEAKK